MSAPRRRDRLSEFLRQEVAQIVLLELSDPRLEGVTVTRAEVSDDIQQAKVFLRVLGGEGRARAALHALDGAAGKIRGMVGKRMQTRYTPRIAFLIDEAVDRERRMNTLLDQVQREFREPDPDAPEGHAPAPGSSPLP